MNIRTKTNLFFTAFLLVLGIVVGGVSLEAFRSFSIASSEEHIRTAAEIVRVHLTDSMINGTIEKRDGFLKRLTEIQGFKSARVVRSDDVNHQFGKGRESESSADEVEAEVFRTGMPAYRILQQGGETIFRGTIPFVATASGTPNCLSCHQVKAGTVLGAVTISLSIEHLRVTALWTVAGLALAVFVFLVLLLLVMRRFLIKPISDTAANVEAAVQRALVGDFTATIDRQTNDEIGKIADDMNRLLAFLNAGLKRIGANISQLTNRSQKEDENLLNATIEMVEGLAKSAHFKQAIEEDESPREIYHRIASLLHDEFSIREYSIYEMDNAAHKIIPIMVDGEVTDSCRWCDPQIMVRSEACRARRTGHVVDGFAYAEICMSFVPPEDKTGYSHLCVPIIQSGSVGSVLQMVAPASEAARYSHLLNQLTVYLRDTAPVLEAKRLMDSLREANLRDPMTGLGNRRFLEEYVDTLIASVQRRQIHLSILMLDLDYFKMVNDTYGHDAGDTVLKALAKILRQAVRASDLVIRYGGEEFLIILQDAEGNMADRVAENIREAVEKLKIPVGGTTLQKTISIGVSDFPSDSDTFWQAVKYADVALYRAKETGRNRVVRFAAEMWEKNEAY